MKSLTSSSNPLIFVSLFISPQDFSDSQVVGLWGSYSPKETPPVKKNLIALISISFAISISLTVSKQENRSLSFSKSDRQMFL